MKTQAGSDSLVEVKRDILNTLSLVDDQEQRALLEMHYLQGMLWIDIGKTLGYSPRHIRRLHQEAMKKVCKIKNLSANVPCGPGVDVV